MMQQMQLQENPAQNRRAPTLFFRSSVERYRNLASQNRGSFYRRVKDKRNGSRRSGFHSALCRADLKVCTLTCSFLQVSFARDLGQ
jgi:hypothetical protein